MAVSVLVRKHRGGRMKLTRQELEVRDRALLARIRCGDHEALRELFYAYFPHLLRFTERQLRVSYDAADVVHDVFMSVWQRRGTLEIRDNVYTYLFSAVRMRSRDVRKRQAQIEHFEVDTPSGSPAVVPKAAIVAPSVERDATALDIAQRVEEILCDMAVGMQECYRLSRLHHCSNAEIAEAMGVSVNTVNVQMSRALKVIATSLAAKPL
jgi:RNA polymerase sigma-70 factor (ECF subfamily)